MRPPYEVDAKSIAELQPSRATIFVTMTGSAGRDIRTLYRLIHIDSPYINFMVTLDNLYFLVDRLGNRDLLFGPRPFLSWLNLNCLWETIANKSSNPQG